MDGAFSSLADVRFERKVDVEGTELVRFLLRGGPFKTYEHFLDTLIHSILAIC